MKKENILIYGLGITGISTVKALNDLNFNIYTYDSRKVNIDELEGYDYSPISDFDDIFNRRYKYVVKSPGIKLNDPIYKKLIEKYEVISDIELSYRLFKDKNIISITGTNGKTTTTSMINFILNESGINSVSVGNIGEGILYQMRKDYDVYVEELSSFQLHETNKYKTPIAIILNITADHLDWHGDFKNYYESKLKIIKNQTEDDIFIKNHDDPLLKDVKSKAKTYEFSCLKEVKRGMFLKDNYLYLKTENNLKKYISVDELKIVGKHNYMNAMAAILALRSYGLDDNKIIKNIKNFRPVKHRLEFVKQINDVRFFNDSKATNVDSAIKALDAFKENVILIAGGYDKKVDLEEFVKKASENTKLMILFGQTQKILQQLCKKYSIDYILVKNMNEAIKVVKSKMKPKDIVLLSPACASWGMYDNFEQRGNDFIKEVDKMMEEK
ncbi:MAG: UDP-N-acetylmuramoyl-L-alanine--D-glutamate ligase [Tissierellia bacterium]|nr:UDP-N-acetylmuramoyl-L-alanine--D-glutamate ligase [Tissierellia bacterium]